MSTIDSVEGLEALPQDSVIRVPTNGDVLVRCGAYWFCVGSEETWASASLDKDLPAETLHPRTVSKPTAEQVLTIAEGLRKRFAVSNGTQVWVEFQGSAEALADEIADIFTQLQVQAPVGEGLENGASGEERRWMIATLDAVDVEHDFDSGDIPSTTTYVDALLAAGYRKPTLPSVDEMTLAQKMHTPNNGAHSERGPGDTSWCTCGGNYRDLYEHRAEVLLDLLKRGA